MSNSNDTGRTRRARMMRLLGVGVVGLALAGAGAASSLAAGHRPHRAGHAVAASGVGTKPGAVTVVAVQPTGGKLPTHVTPGTAVALGTGVIVSGSANATTAAPPQG